MDILGINYSPDAAAALIRDGRILAAVTDERFTGKKHSRDFPMDSIRYCLRHAGIDFADLECVSFFWNPGIQLQGFNRRRASAFRHHTEYLWNVPNYLLAHYPGRWETMEVEHIEQRVAVKGAEKPLRIFYITHHLAHAASAFFVSPFDRAAILTVDGYGEKTAALLGQGKDNRVQALKQIDFPHSLGAFYAAVTQYLGFTANRDEGKVMGLAAHGEPRFHKRLKEIVRLEPDGGIEVDLAYFDYHQERARRYSRKFLETFGPDRRPEEPLDERHRDMAKSAQTILEDALIHLARHLKTVTGEKNLCMAGGVALNCVANSRVLEETDFGDAFIQPAAGDNGTSLGSALWVYHQLFGKPREQIMTTDFLGPEYQDEEIGRELSEAGVKYEDCPDIAGVCAERLAKGEIIGWFQGRMEFGPRALGNRSILADPRRAEVKTRLDATIKRREAFRPYAPAVLTEACPEYFVGPGDSPFMLKSYSVREEKRGTIPAVVHVDGSARVQTVSSKSHPLFSRLIREFAKRTDVPILLNTSFNGRGETIVCSVKDALRCFCSTGLDALAVGRFLVHK